MDRQIVGADRAQIVHYPTDRACPFEPPPHLYDIQRDLGPICSLAYPDGHVGWLVTGAELACEILTDPRFSARSELKRSPVARPGADPFIGQPALPGWFVDMDRPDHTRLRRVTSRLLSLRECHALEPRIEAIVDRCLDGMAKAGGPVDLLRVFALPVPTLVICELLGVPYAEHASFEKASACLFSLDATAADAERAMAELEQLIRGILRSPIAPGGMLGEMRGRPDLDEDEAVGMSVLLLTAGHETVSGTLGVSVFMSLSQPKIFEGLTRDPDGVVEELLRYLTTFHMGVPRSALEPVEIGGCLIRPGEAITIALPAVNRDPALFEDPHRFDPDRAPNRHLAFGYGAHRCIGQHLARLELRTALSRLAKRFPGLRLAVPVERIALRKAGFLGLEVLPVTW